MLATILESPYKFCLAICAALAVGNKTLNKYYNMTDYLELYCISMGVCWLVNIHLITDYSTFSPSPSTQACCYNLDSSFLFFYLIISDSSFLTHTVEQYSLMFQI